MRWPKARKTRLQILLAMIDCAVFWKTIVDEIAPHYPRPGNGRQPVPLEIMVRIYASAKLIGANDRQIEEILIDSPALCAWCHLDDSKASPPDSETIGNFRRLLLRVGLAGIIERHVEVDLAKRGASLIPGEIREPRWCGPRL